MSQVVFAREAEMDSSLLASYEHGRVPLKYRTADRICECFGISQRWLAEGVGPKQPYVTLDHSLTADCGPNVLFSKVYFERLKARLDQWFESIAAALACKEEALNPEDVKLWAVPPAGMPPEESAAFMVQRRFTILSRTCNPQVRSEFIRAVDEVVQQIYADLHSELDLLRCSVNPAEVSTRLNRLITRVCRIAKRPGAKSDLARFLGVPQSRVSEWLSEKFEPGGETTLQILDWVRAEEARPKKGPGDALTSQGETRLKENKDEHQKPSPRKK